jgi:hypothetical protein
VKPPCERPGSDYCWQLMRFRAVLAVVAALVAFLSASILGERLARAEVRANSPFSGASAAPLCDERGASAYAAEPAPQPIDGGAFVQAAEGGCKAALVSDGPASPSRDDLQRTPEVPHDSSALLPAVAALVPVALEGDVERAVLVPTPGDEHRQNDNPPPKPIPWRS